MQHPYGWISGIMLRGEASCEEARHHVERRGIMWRRETSCGDARHHVETRNIASVRRISENELAVCFQFAVVPGRTSWMV